MVNSEPLASYCNDALRAVALFEHYSKLNVPYDTRPHVNILRFSLFLNSINSTCELYNLIKYSSQYNMLLNKICKISYKKIFNIRQGAVHVHNDVHKIRKHIGSRASFNTVIGRGTLLILDGKEIGKNEYDDDILIVYGDCELHVFRDLQKVLLSIREILLSDSQNVAF